MLPPSPVLLLSPLCLCSLSYLLAESSLSLSPSAIPFPSPSGLYLTLNLLILQGWERKGHLIQGASSDLDKKSAPFLFFSVVTAVLTSSHVCFIFITASPQTSSSVLLQSSTPWGLSKWAHRSMNESQTGDSGHTTWSFCLCNPLFLLQDQGPELRSYFPPLIYSISDHLWRAWQLEWILSNREMGLCCISKWDAGENRVIISQCEWV